MKKIFFSFITYFSCLTILANDSLILPKPIKLDFFELNNKLTAKHKRQLNKALYLINKYKNYEVVITAGLENARSSYVVYDKRMENTIAYLKKGINKKTELYYDYGIDRTLNRHEVIINFKFFYKDAIKNEFYVNSDTIAFAYIPFLEKCCMLSKKRIILLEEIALFLKNNNTLFVNIKTAGGEGNQKSMTSNCRLRNIENYFVNICHFKKERVLIETSDEFDENSVDISVYKKRE